MLTRKERRTKNPDILQLIEDDINMDPGMSATQQEKVTLPVAYEGSKQERLDLRDALNLTEVNDSEVVGQKATSSILGFADEEVFIITREFLNSNNDAYYDIMRNVDGQQVQDFIYSGNVDLGEK